MSYYQYVARNEMGQRHSGLHQAPSSGAVANMLQAKMLVPVSIEKVKGNRRVKERNTRRKRVKSVDLAGFCWQMNTMIEGGVPITDSMDTISEDMSNLSFRNTIMAMSEKMKTGETFADSVKQHPDTFNSMFCAMILAGETSGNLPLVLDRMARYYDGRDRMITKVKRALAYPVFVVAFVILIVVAMMVFIIPRFQGIFDQTKGELPAFTRGFMAVYDLIMSNAPYLLIGFGLVFMLLVAYHKTESGRSRISRLVLSLPLIGPIVSHTFIYVFCRTVSTLLGAGVSIIDSLEILSGMTDNDQIKGSINHTREHVVEGSSISVSMSSGGFFPKMVSRMVQVGEESGSLPIVLDKTSDYYEKKVEDSINSLTGFIEPAMIVTVGAIVLVVILALYLPVFTMSDI
jgi:type IV pilus assembly protein PilC